VLRELVGLTMHISAQVDSRLAGAGLFLVPDTAKRALQAALGIDPNDEDAEDPVLAALMEAMLTAIKDRANAAALVPLTMAVPDETVELFRHITFSTPLDEKAAELRDESIRRLALGQDAPPELLLGTSGMNHWGSWLVQEDVITTHVEPPLALICDAYTTQWLWPVLMENGLSPEQAHRYVVWYDVSDLMVRPNHSQDAFTLHERGVITDKALRAATGFDDSDGPEWEEALDDPMVSLALDLCSKSPSLLNEPGLAKLVDSLRVVIEGKPSDPELAPPPPPQLTGGDEEPDTEEEEEPDAPADGSPPDSAGDPAQPEEGPPGIAAGGYRFQPDAWPAVSGR